MSTEEKNPDAWGDLNKAAAKVLLPGVSASAVTDMYNTWADSGYDSILLNATSTQEYGAPKILAKTMMELFPENRQQAVVLDVGAGTGISGRVLLDIGFVTVDGLEPAAKMLLVAQEKQIYRKVFNCYITGEPLDIPPDSYDAVVLAGAIGHGAVPCAAFEEMARLVKPGGYIVNCMRRAYLQEVADYAQNWETMVERLEREGKWKVVRLDPYPNHFIGNEGGYVVNCMRRAYLQEVADNVQNWEPMVERLGREGNWKVVRIDSYPNHFIDNDGLLVVFQMTKSLPYKVVTFHGSDLKIKGVMIEGVPQAEIP